MLGFQSSRWDVVWNSALKKYQCLVVKVSSQVASNCRRRFSKSRPGHEILKANCIADPPALS